jgi:hypothetical protein
MDSRDVEELEATLEGRPPSRGVFGAPDDLEDLGGLDRDDDD